MELTRRQFVSLVGGSIITVYGTPAEAFLKKIGGTEEGGKMVERFIPSVCHQCPAGCGIVCRVVNGKLVKIEGNKLHPINQGTLCPKGQIGTYILYDPDRITGPLKRTSPKKGLREDPQFVQVSWEHALNDIAARMRRLREEGLSHTVGILGGRYRGQSHDVAAKFLTLYGSPNDLGHSSICADASKTAHYALDGNLSYSAYDWDNCNYFLNFGAGLLEAWRPTTRLIRAYGHMRRGRPVRAKIVTFDTRLSVSASKSDEWFPVLPGSDGAIALAMAHVILTEGLWNKDFIGDFIAQDKKFDTGYITEPGDFKEQWTLGIVAWWNDILKDFTPEKAAAISGVAAKHIRRIAREFAATPGAIAAGERGAGAYTNGTYNRMAIHALNGLVGSMYSRGGVMYQQKPPYAKWPVDEKEFTDDIAKEHAKFPKIDKSGSKEWPMAKAVYQNIADNHANRDPYGLRMIFTYYTNPLFSTPHPQRFERAFKDVFIVESSSYLSETSLYADYILPDHSYLEKWLDDPIYPSLGYAATGLRQPVVKPLYNTRNFMDVLIDIGKRLGGKTGEYFTAIGSFEGLIRHVSTGLDMPFEEWRKKGVWVGPAYPYIQKTGAFYKNGKMMTPEEVKKDLFKTDSGKFEFRSSKLAGKGFNPYPHYEKPRFAGGKEYDLHISTPKLITHAEGRGANVPLLQASFDVATKSGWKSVLQISPKAAIKRGIADGAWVWIESPVGKIKVRAKYFEGCHPKVVVLPFERGHAAYGRYAKNKGVNPNLVIANLTDPVSGQAAYNATMVKVYPA